MERMNFSDNSRIYEVSENGKSKKGGCYVSTAVGFLLMLLAVALAVGVGLIVHFAGNNKQLICNCPSVNGGQTMKSDCMKMAAAGDTASAEICKSCPTLETTTMTQPTATTSAPATKVTDVRIPLALYPVYTDVELRPNMYDGPAKDFTFDGYVRIQLRCDTPANNITLHMNKLTIHNNTLEFGAEPGTATAPSIVRWDWDKDRQFMVIHLDGMLIQNGLYYVKMNYSSPFTAGLEGLYLSNYKRDNKTVYIATTQFQPTAARKAFPCFDEPAIKSYYNITLVRKNHMKSLSNMPIARTDNRGDNWVADVFETSPKMPVYLLAFVICDFEYTSATTKNNVLYRVWSRPASISHTAYALENGVKVLTYFEDYFNIPYPLPKQDMIAVPDFSAGAMENWGLIVYRESAMLYKPGVSTERNKEFVAIIVAHEVAHQWFGNLVSPSWWDDLWLNEGFATFEESSVVDALYPEWKKWEHFSLIQQSVFNFDGLISSHPLYVPVAHPDEINEIFDQISYDKGAAVIRMMQFFLGEETFRTGLSKYLTKLSYGAATHDDLWQSLTEQSAADGKNINVKDVMDTWTLQMNYPVVTVTRIGDTRIKVTQQRYLRDPTATDPGTYTSPFGYKWKIPFAFTSSKEKQFNKTDADITWMEKTTSQMELDRPTVVPDQSDSDSWILGNPMQYGYYRVNYDTQNWLALIKQLKTDHTVINPINRAQIINDAWNLAKAGMVSMDIALQTVDYLDKEMNDVPWKAANAELGYVRSMLANTGVYGDFEAVMRAKVEETFKKVGMDNTGATHAQSYLRTEIAQTACRYGVQDCINESLRLFRQWMKKPSVNPINPDLKSTVYCAALRYGGVEEWDFAFKQYTEATVATESSLLLATMSCASQPWILTRYLERALSMDQIRKQDATTVFIYVARNPVASSLVWDFFRAQWDSISKNFASSFSFGSVVEGVTASLNTKFDMDQLKDFKAKNPNQGAGKRAFQQAVEKTQANVKWMSNNMETVKTWLKNKAVVEPPTPTPQPKDINVRLPMALYPLEYDIELRPNIYEGPAKDFTFNGYVRIQLRCDSPTNNVTLHTNGLMINNSSLEFGSETAPTVPPIVRWEWDKDRQFMVIHLNDMLVPGDIYYVKMNYTGPLKDDLAGLYLSSYKRDNKTIYLATTQFQPTDARKAFPCFDEPAVKSIFNIILVRKNHMLSLSNMPRLQSVDRGDNWMADVFGKTVKMPVYLLAFVVCDYTYVERSTQDNITFRVWSRPASINQTEYALDVGVKLLDYFDSFFGIPYALPKQDMIAVPDFVARAMENWGLIVYRENVMLFQEGVSTERNRDVAAYLVSHEIAHQWFGNLVTPSWWDDLWLNEGFATFEGYMGVDFVHPDWKIWEQFALVMHNAFNFDGLVSSHPVYVPVGHPDQIFEIFDSISYEKGASVIRMMKFFLGDSTYQTGISNYLKNNAYSDAFHDDLWQAMTDQAAREGKNINVKSIMDTWTLQMNYPVVTLTRQGNTTRLRVTQQRYLRDPNAADPGTYTSDFGYKWDIPLTFTSSKEKDFTKTYADITWMNKTNSELMIDSPTVVPDQSNSNSWILGNPMQYGYYRVNYETQNWLALINQLKTDPKMIHPINRAQIINDAWNLAKAGMLSQNIALQTVEYLDREMDYVPWRAANRELNYVKSMLSKTGVFGGFQDFMRSKVESVFKKLGMDNTGATHLESYMRSEIAGTACSYGVKTCEDESLKLYRQWMDNPAVNPIDPDLKSTVYCTAIGNGGAAEWDFAFKQYETATVAAESVLLLTAMGCASQPWILSRYLERALTPSQIRKQDALDVFVYVSGNPIGRGLAWNYLVAKWDLIFSDYSGSFFAFRRMIEGTTSSFNTEQELNQLKNFITAHPNLGSGTRSFQQAVEKTQANIKWMENNVETIKTWLKNQDGTTPTTPEPINVRLPMALYPVKYDIELRPNIYEGPAKDFTFNGYVRIQLRCDSPTNNVTLHTNDLTINSSSLEFGAEPGTGTAPSIVGWEWDKDRQFMVIHLNGMLVQGGLYYVKINYTGPLKDDLAGLYLSSYKRDNKTIYLATTQFQPTDARKAFPCFDEPAVKSVFNIILVRKNHMLSLSNMPRLRSVDRGDNWVADVYDVTPKMPVYLLAFVVCDYTYVERFTPKNVTFRVWSRPASINQTAYSLDIGVKLLDYFESYFDITYPLPKQDMIAVPDFVARAMENWGLIVYRENVMLFQEGVSTERNRDVAAYLVSHEIAHQWFGNLVTPSWWDDLWLNEGFATFEGYMGVDFAHPDWKTWEQFALIMHNAFNFDGLVSSHPVYVPVGHPDQIFEIFDSISYEKGASVIRMMKFFVGDSTYQRGMTNYLRSNAYSDAFHDDLWQAMTDQAAQDGMNINVKEIMDTWTLQMNYPVVTVTRHGNTTLIKVTQQRYLRDPNAVDPGTYTSDFGYMWDIPLTFTSSKEKDFTKTYADIKWMNKTTSELMIDSPTVVPDQSDSNSWILGNPMMYGYYRVNYDTQNWQALINQLKTDPKMIHTVNRAQIINDAWNLAKAGMLSQNIALQTVEYLDKEMDYVPWRAANRELNYVKTMLSKTGVFGGFQAFMKSKVEGVFKKLGMDNTGATHLESYMRSEIASTACSYGVKTCVDESLKLYRQWMDNPAVNPIDPDLKSTVYCTAIGNGGAAEWDFAFKQYETATVAAESVLLLTAMGCASQPWILSRYLERALTPSQIRKQDALDVFVYVSGNPIGRGLAWNYLVARWDLIFSDYSGSFFAFRRMIEGTTSSFNTQQELIQLQNFISAHPNLGSGTRSFQQAVEKTKSNIKWMENNVETIKVWLQNKATSTAPKTKVTDVRIPLALYPVYFDVELRPNMYEGPAANFTFDGYVRIQLRCDTPTNNVTLHMNRLIINNSSLEFGAEPGTATAPSIVRWDWDKDRQFMVVHLDGMLVQDGLYYIKMNYTSPLKDDLAGLYLSSYKRDNKTIYIATTQFQPTDARKAFPCFDEPAVKSYFNITLVRKNTMKSLSNMPIAQTDNRGDNWMADVFQTSPKMPVYLLAFIVCDYVYTESTTTNNVLYRAWSRPASINQTTFALDAGVKILTYFEQYFEIPFPLPKQDMVAVPDFVARAMENWGLIVYRESAMLFEPGVSTERNKDDVAYVVSHELAHQWFGNLVSPSWWDDLWLNEGFATFEGYMGVDFVYPDWKIWEQFALIMQNAFNFDGLVSSHPVYVPVGHPDEIYEIFDSISYEKGAAIIRMMRFFLGPQTFQKGLSNYLKKKSYDAAFHDDLWQSMTEQATIEGKNIDVKAIMDTWTLQMNYPVVMVTRTGNTRITITQHRYLQDPSAPDPGKYTSDFGYKWDVPFTFTSSRERKFNKTNADITWLRKEMPQFEIDSLVIPDQSDSNSWILGNPMMYGYYRVNYETQNWQALINQLKTDPNVIDPVNRAQIINDAWNLAKSGVLSQDIAFSTVEYLYKEMDYVPWRSALKELAYLQTMLSKSAVYGDFEAFMRSQVEGIFTSLGMNNTGSSHLQTFLRTQVVGAACQYGVQACSDESLKLYRQWMDTPENNPIDPDLRATVYCTAIGNGGVKEWDFAFKQYETTTVAADSDLLLTSMGCSRQPWIISRYLERALTPGKIRKQDALDVFVHVSRNPIGQSLAWDYMVTKWDLIFSDYSASFFAFRRLISAVTAPFNTAMELNQLQNFMETHPNLGTGARAFQQGVEKTQANIKWMKNNMAAVKSWLANQG